MRAKGPANERLASSDSPEAGGPAPAPNEKKPRAAAKSAPVARPASEPKEQKSKSKQNGSGAGAKQSARVAKPEAAAAPMTAVAFDGEARSSVAAPRRASVDEIAKRAWEIWQQQGCPAGKDLEHWYQAEQELSQA